MPDGGPGVKFPIMRKKSTRTRSRPDHHVGMKLGKGWNERNFVSEVVIPSIFTPRHSPGPLPPFSPVPEGRIGITWIGHASFLIRTAEHSLVIDPNWAKWLKVIKRMKQPGVELRDLPSIDLVLVTHAHFDHLDKKSLKAIAADQPIAVPDHVGPLVSRLGYERVHELRPWESFRHGHLHITLTPARHWGARMLHDSHRGFGGFLINYKGRTVFHCGDSAYFDGFREIGEKADVEIALLPIGAYDAPTRRDVHMNPEEALCAFVELGASTMIPMHFGTFRLSYEPLQEPPIRLMECARGLGLTDRIRLLTEGETAIL